MNFQKVEEKFKLLKSQHVEGQLADSELKSKLDDLMIQDNQGRWWMIGYETGQWYYNDGTQWVRADPNQTQFPQPFPPPVNVVIPKPPVSENNQGPNKPSYWIAILAHLFFGFGLFYVDKSLKRKWLYPLMVFSILFISTVFSLLFNGNDSSLLVCFGSIVLLVSMLSFLDVILTCRSCRAKISGILHGA
jgi:hypothetical protein